MQIMNYIIPKSLQKNNFLLSLKDQYENKGKLSPKQIWALEDILEIELDFFDWNATCPLEDCQDEFDKLMAKMKRNRFRKIKNRNKCIRAIESILNENVNWALVNDALGLNFNPYYRRW